MTTYVLVGGAWLGAGIGRESPVGCGISATTPTPSPSPASASGCTSPLPRSTSKPTSPTW
jgi:hypothetical protein